ncbi:MAG: ATP-binding protein [Jatrophihabitans sp.]|uniref:ATP-binding protein n=1 Tax=Jatrophihabitans sp. TaxID=1932789 RepID=UPI003F823FE2
MSAPLLAVVDLDTAADLGARELETVVDVELRPPLPIARTARLVTHRFLPGRHAVADVAGALAAMSVRQAGPSVRLRLRHGLGTVLVEVEDHSVEFPPLRCEGDPVATALIDDVARLSAAWGYRRLPRGRQIWARVERSADPVA